MDANSIIYADAFVPAEWIAAHGLRPIRLAPRPVSRSAFARMGVCPYAQAFLDTVFGSSAETAAVFATTCDQMRRLSEFPARGQKRRVFLFNVPATWQTETARALYRAELERLARFLLELGAKTPSAHKVGETFRAYDDSRKALRAMRPRLSAGKFAAAVSSFHECGTVPEFPAQRDRASGVPIAVVGGPLLGNQMDLFNLIEQSGGWTVLDATAMGERGLPAALDLQLAETDPLEALVRAYFDTIPDAFRRPNSMLYTWLAERIEERGAAGIIVLHYTWCDLWHAEAGRIERSLGRPVLALDLGAEEVFSGRLSTRIQAFVESLQ